LSSTIAALSAHLTLAELPKILPERSRIGTKILLRQYQFYYVKISDRDNEKSGLKGALRIRILALPPIRRAFAASAKRAAKGVAAGEIDQN
jgi:hypothetical protein